MPLLLGPSAPGFQGDLPFRDNTLFGLNGAWKFPNPWYDVASEFIPTDINNIFEWCTPAGTLVELDHCGHTAPVETLKVGDQVLTGGGTIRPIEKAGSRHIKGEICHLSISGFSGTGLTITPDHPVRAWRPPEGRKASKLEWGAAGHLLKYVPAGEVQAGDWLFSPAATTNHEITEFPYSPFLVGMYISEGCLLKRYLTDGMYHARGVQFTLGSNEVVRADYNPGPPG